MYKNISYLFLLCVLAGGLSCSKDEERVNVLRKQYDVAAREAEPDNQDFFVNLDARALQAGEKGEWEIVKGTIVDDLVLIEDKTNPSTRFKGLPGEEYTLQWTRRTVSGSKSSVEIKVKIPEPVLEIKEDTRPNFQTIRTLSVDSRFRGTWSFSPAYGHLSSDYHDGRAELPEKKPRVSLHGYANTSYTATFEFSYGGKIFRTRKVIQTGNYTEDEGLSELQLSRDSYRVITDKNGSVLELDLEGARIAWILIDPGYYPALTAFKKLRRLDVGGTNLERIPEILGDNFLELEELYMNRMGSIEGFPENFGNLVKLKTLIYSPLYSYSSSSGTPTVLPKSFANLKSLESIDLVVSNSVDFNGTLGGLTALKTMRGPLTEIPDNIGNLKNLKYLDISSKSTTFPAGFSGCSSLQFARINFGYLNSGEVVLSPQIGALKQLETLEIITKNLRTLPASFGNLSSLKTLRIESQTLETIPDNFGDLSSLETLSLYGTFTIIPSGFGKLSRLKSLFLGGRAESLPESFGDLVSLGHFNAEYSRLKSLPQSIGKLKKLKGLFLRGSALESVPASLGELDSLATIDLNATRLKTFPTAIIPLKSITAVYLNYTNTGDIPDDISKMKSGVTLNLFGVENLTLDRIKYLVSITKGMVFSTSYGFFSS